MITKLFDEDPMMGTRQFWHYDPETDQATIETQTDVTELVDRNQYEHRLHDGTRSRWKGDFHRVASIPMPIYEELRSKGMLPTQDEPAFRRWMNDPDNVVFRTRPGRV